MPVRRDVRAESVPTLLWLVDPVVHCPTTFLPPSTQTVSVLVPPPSTPSTTYERGGSGHGQARDNKDDDMKWRGGRSGMYSIIYQRKGDFFVLLQEKKLIAAKKKA